MGPDFGPGYGPELGPGTFIDEFRFDPFEFSAAVFDPLAGFVETPFVPVEFFPEPPATEETGLTLDLSASTVRQVQEGTDFNDNIRTGSGNDTVMPRGGSDFVDGGGGSDTIGYSTNLDVGITIDINAG